MVDEIKAALDHASEVRSFPSNDETLAEKVGKKEVEEVQPMKAFVPDFWLKVLIASVWMVGGVFLIVGLYVAAQIGTAKGECINTAYQSFAQSYCNVTPQYCDCNYGGCYIKGVPNMSKSFMVLNRTGE
jgi:hypothetical protein